jgi:hypothetical protein
MLNGRWRKSMQIARPPNGFHVVEKPAVAALISANTKKFPRLPKFWEAIKDRLRITGHREGVTLPHGKPGWKLFVEDGAPDVGIPRVKVVYRALGDTLTIYIIAIE